MLEELKESLHQQRNMIYSLGINGNTKLTVNTFWTCVLRLFMHHPTYSGNRKQPFFPMNVKAEEIRPSQRRHFSPFVVSCDEVLGNEAKVQQYYKTLQDTSPRNQICPIQKPLTSWCQEWALQLYVPHIYAFEDPRAEWANTLWTNWAGLS